MENDTLYILHRRCDRTTELKAIARTARFTLHSLHVAFNCSYLLSSIIMTGNKSPVYTFARSYRR